MSEPTSEIFPLSEEEILFREKESLKRESWILECLKDVYSSIITNDPKLDRKSDSLEQILLDSFTAWQFFSDGKEGLNSGGIGQAFTRLLGSGIMVDMPEVEDVPHNSFRFGVQISRTPTNDSDIGNIKVVSYLNDKEIKKICTFTFSTSLVAINERINKVSSEIRTPRKE